MSNSFAPPPNRALINHPVVASTSVDNIAKVDVTALNDGLLLEVHTTGNINGRGAVACRTVFAFIREGGGGLVAYAKAETVKAQSTGAAFVHDAVTSGGNYIVQAQFSAVSTGSNLKHYVRLIGGLARMLPL